MGPYIVIGLLVGPFVAGDIVTDEDLEAAGLDAAHLIRIGHIDIAPAEA